LPAPRSQQRVEVLLRVPALRETGRVIFPGIGPMSDADFVNLVRDAMARGYRVRVKNLPHGQAAVPIIKTDKRASLLVSSEFRREVQGLRAVLRVRKRPSSG
jgi:hypothetical protein